MLQFLEDNNEFYPYEVFLDVVERKSASTSPTKKSKDFNLENVLRRCSADAVNHESILQLKDVPRGVYRNDMRTNTYMLTFSAKNR
jgi:hypothetical protein